MGLIIKDFDNQAFWDTWLIIKSFDYFVYKTFTHKSKKPDYIHWVSPYHNHLHTLSQSYQPPSTVDYLCFLYVSLQSSLVFSLKISCRFPTTRKTHCDSIPSPESRCKATVELSLHPHNIRVRLVDMRVSWQTTNRIVKNTFESWLNLSDIN
jgi:hypothetical protein